MMKPKRPKTAAERRQRYDEILQALDRHYPNVTCALHHENPWQLLVATILSAQCTDERVNKVTPGLFRKYKTIEAFAQADLAELSQDIRSTGFFNNKAKSLIGAAQTVLNDFHGTLPQDIDLFLTIPGAARKTANVVLGTAFGLATGVVVDTHVARITNRLDFTKESNPVKIEQDLVKIVPQKKWIQFSHQVIHFGRGICVARKPKCHECFLTHLCYAPDRTYPAAIPADSVATEPGATR